MRLSTQNVLGGDGALVVIGWVSVEGGHHLSPGELVSEVLIVVDIILGSWNVGHSFNSLFSSGLLEFEAIKPFSI